MTESTSLPLGLVDSNLLPQPVDFWARLLLIEAFVLVAYFALTSTSPTGEVRYLLYPFVWINVCIWAIRRVSLPDTTSRHRVGAGVVAGVYLLVLLYIPGLIGPGVGGTPIDLRIAPAAPGWGPILALTSPWLRVYLIPFEFVGYATLAYLVFTTVLVSTRGALSGVLGLATCVGCTVPILAPLIGLFGGPAAGLSTAAFAWSYDIGTAVFVGTVALLVWSVTTAGSGPT